MKPEYKQIAITTVEGVVIMCLVTKDFTDGEVNWEREPSDENINAEILKSGIDALSWRIIKESEIPTDRTFRDAWKDEGGAIVHDMAKVKTIHLARLRIQRNALLTKKDELWMRATGQNKPQEIKDIETARQALRDFPHSEETKKRFEEATTVEEVKAIKLNEYSNENR